jgi:hypothetical protein
VARGEEWANATKNDNSYIIVLFRSAKCVVELY